jgi:hypothetical protein
LITLEREVNPENPKIIESYGVGDMVRVADLVITTSVLEGFGFAYLEPWILDRPVVGRSIPFITPDFQSQGMKLGHLYTVLIVDDQDYKDIGKNKPTPEKALQERLSRILKLKQQVFVDKTFARNETTTRATLRLLDEKKRKSAVTINKKIVKTIYSQQVVGKQLHEVITSAK